MKKRPWNSEKKTLFCKLSVMLDHWKEGLSFIAD